MPAGSAAIEVAPDCGQFFGCVTGKEIMNKNIFFSSTESLMMGVGADNTGLLAKMYQ